MTYEQSAVGPLKLPSIIIVSYTTYIVFILMVRLIYVCVCVCGVYGVRERVCVCVCVVYGCGVCMV